MLTVKNFTSVLTKNYRLPFRVSSLVNSSPFSMKEFNKKKKTRPQYPFTFKKIYLTIILCILITDLSLEVELDVHDYESWRIIIYIFIFKCISVRPTMWCAHNNAMIHCVMEMSKLVLVNWDCSPEIWDRKFIPDCRIAKAGICLGNVLIFLLPCCAFCFVFGHSQKQKYFWGC